MEEEWGYSNFSAPSDSRVDLNAAVIDTPDPAGSGLKILKLG
jgi:hypothetical protein